MLQRWQKGTRNTRYLNTSQWQQPLKLDIRDIVVYYLPTVVILKWPSWEEGEGGNSYRWWQLNLYNTGTQIAKSIVFVRSGTLTRQFTTSMLHIRNYWCLRNVQTSSMAHPISHLVDSAGWIPGGKATEWGSPLSYLVPRVPLSSWVSSWGVRGLSRKFILVRMVTVLPLLLSVQGWNWISIYFIRWLSCHNQWVPKHPKFLGHIHTRGAGLQTCRILLELLRIYQGSVTSGTFHS
jgi:hypothetical protein